MFELLVLPAASKPSMRILISRLAKSLFMILLTEPPMLDEVLRLFYDNSFVMGDQKGAMKLDDSAR